ncbi:hypothetical protein G4B88_020033 [Cannabis sativa]|uniref:Uncharacterized protein n=1 Tax=Cannabis sativa TaxID=3483 RepID=A0A7J6FD75_CANSA|nr:hypothetical protein G4B88_020033 [Cannabis sativa]
MIMSVELKSERIREYVELEKNPLLGVGSSRPVGAKKFCLQSSSSSQVSSPSLAGVDLFSKPRRRHHQFLVVKHATPPMSTIRNISFTRLTILGPSVILLALTILCFFKLDVILDSLLKCFDAYGSMIESLVKLNERFHNSKDPEKEIVQKIQSKLSQSLPLSSSTMGKRSLEEGEEQQQKQQKQQIKPSNMLVSFSKRRDGLFKKATGIPHAFRHTSVDENIQHYLYQTTIIPRCINDEQKHQKQRIEGLNCRLKEIRKAESMDEESKVVLGLKHWIENEVEADCGRWFSYEGFKSLCFFKLDVIPDSLLKCFDACGSMIESLVKLKERFHNSKDPEKEIVQKIQRYYG